MKPIAAALCLLILLLGACKTVSNENPLQFDSAPLFGMIYDMDNRPCAGVSLLLDGGQKSVTDLDGRFVLLGVKRGTHTLTAASEDREPLEARFDFQNQTHVLYLKMVSFDQLLSQAQDALDRRKWADADRALRRAAAIHEADTVLVYLRAILDRQQGDSTAAAARLESLLAGGGAAPTIYLFLADLYQDSLGKPAAARGALEEYLKQVEDADVRKRLEDLKSAESGGVGP